MARSDEYRRLAAEALALANEFNEPARAVLLQMAQTWLRLAEQSVKLNNGRPDQEP
jgi:hypothetical protein